VRSERGSATAFVVVLTVALVAVAGLVFDGGLTLAAHRRAFNEAEAAARAGAQAIDLDALRAGRGVLVDRAEAERRVRDYLATSGHDAIVHVDGAVVHVHVRFQQPTTILSSLGVGPLTVDGEGRARAVRGVTEGEP
jgi:hypothetical protein